MRIWRINGAASDTKSGFQARYQGDTPLCIGNKVYIETAAKVIDDIDIADNIVIGANAVVTKSFLGPGITIAGVQTRKISNNGLEVFGD